VNSPQELKEWIALIRNEPFGFALLCAFAGVATLFGAFLLEIGKLFAQRFAPQTRVFSNVHSRQSGQSDAAVFSDSLLTKVRRRIFGIFQHIFRKRAIPFLGISLLIIILLGWIFWPRVRCAFFFDAFYLDCLTE
jgi:hypothetical protein